MPTFAGITEKENKMSIADRQKQIGKGLAGSVLRNILLDMYEKNIEKRKDAKEGRKKISSSSLEKLRKYDEWEILQQKLREVFGCVLNIKPFNELYHTYIRVELYKGKYENGRFKKYPGFSNRDIMVEGSGFLQWLSVYSLALNKNIDVLLLDEPDAHLHSTLQLQLLEQLEELLETFNKQVLIGTHSTEIIKNISVEKIMQVKDNSTIYLNEEHQKIELMAGLGSEYSPKIQQLQLNKKMLMVENNSDANLLKIWCGKLNKKWPDDLVIWPWASSHKERKQLFIQLKSEINGLVAISLTDRDNDNLNTVGKQLTDKKYNSNLDGLALKKWRRRNIENYLLCPTAIARICQKKEDEVINFFKVNYSLAINNINFIKKDAPSPLVEADGKEIITKNESSVEKVFNCTKEDIAINMRVDEIPEDICVLIDEIVNL